MLILFDTSWLPSWPLVVLALLTILFVAGWLRPLERSQVSGDLGRLIDDVIAALSWETCSDDEDDASSAHALAVAALTEIEGNIAPSMSSPVVETDVRFPSLVAALGTMVDNSPLATSTFAIVRDLDARRWEAHETVDADTATRETPFAATIDLVATELAHVSLLALSPRCRPCMPHPDELGLLVVVCGDLRVAVAGKDRTLRVGESILFFQSPKRSLRTMGDPAMLVLIRLPRPSRQNRIYS